MTVFAKAINSALAFLDLKVRRKVEKPEAPRYGYHSRIAQTGR
jgi:hypothetical protein